MMLRKALIIGSPDREIPGVKDDMRNYRAFLKTPLGGGWYDGEIETLESPTKALLDQKLSQLKTADYSFLVFAGHGEYSALQRTTRLHINSNTTITEDDLKVGAPKRTIIIDACRVLVHETQFSEAMLKAAMESYRSASASRTLFDDSIRACSPGLAVMYGCSIGEAANELEGVGGHYSSSLIKASQDWDNSYTTRNGSVFSVSDAHEKAVQMVTRRTGGSQTPKGEFSRSLPRFPFAVKAS